MRFLLFAVHRFSPNSWESYCSEINEDVDVIGLLLVCLCDSLGVY